MKMTHPDTDETLDTQVPDLWRRSGWTEASPPSKRRSKDELVEAAVEAGMSPAAAEAATKDELIDELT
jgi:hypothetical protein